MKQFWIDLSVSYLVEAETLEEAKEKAKSYLIEGDPDYVEVTDWDEVEEE